MKRIFRSGLFIILIGCFLILGISGPGPGEYVAADDCNPEAVVQIHAPWIAAWWYDLYGNNDPQDWEVVQNFGSLFEPQVRVSQPTVSIYLQKYQYNPSSQINIKVWRVSYQSGKYCAVDENPVIDRTVSSTGWGTGDWQWVSASSATGILLAEEYYSIEVKCLDNKYVRWAYSADPYAFPFEGHLLTTDCDSPNIQGLYGPGSGKYMGAMVQGCWAPPINVLTQDGYVSQDGYVVMGGLVTALGVSGTVKAYIDYGFTEELGNEQFIKNVNTVTPPGSYYNYQLTSWPAGSYLYFRARIVETTSGEVDYGVIKEVFVPEVIPQISCEVVVNDAWDCTFETVINSIDDVPEVDLVLYYGLNWSCYGSPDEVIMFEDVDEPGVYRWNDVNWGIFEPGRTYYYYAEEQIPEGATIVRSETKQFKRYDPNKPAWRNYVENWLAGLWGTADLPEINGWWILAIVVFLIVFFLTTRAKNWRLGLAWGMIAMMVLLYVLVANNLVDPWLVVLLSILAGYIVYKFVFAPVMHK